MGSNPFITVYIYKGNNIKPYKKKKFVGFIEYQRYVEKKKLIHMYISFANDSFIRMKKPDKNKKTDIV